MGVELCSKIPTECFAIIIIQSGAIIVLMMLILLMYRYQIVHKLHPTMIIDVEPIKLNKLQNLANLDMSYDSTMHQQ
ncbi:unnamed protein product [Paramecium pentaurelia]|uniref:Uncharacterized protein n=1 Tax=Paramecium pentaurelia TaxID=43138 RepID=A0A8S1VY37_9CILI|nr:unnamed protein product [Paramecium pentaurelia]